MGEGEKKKKNVEMSRLIFLKVEPGAVEWKCCVHNDYPLLPPLCVSA